MQAKPTKTQSQAHFGFQKGNAFAAFHVRVAMGNAPIPKKSSPALKRIVGNLGLSRSPGAGHKQALAMSSDTQTATTPTTPKYAPMTRMTTLPSPRGGGTAMSATTSGSLTA